MLLVFCVTYKYITASKRSLQKLCFHSCGAVLCPGLFSVQGCSLSRVVLCPGGSLSRGSLSHRGLCLGGSLSRGSLSKGSLSRGSLSRGFSVQGSLSKGLCPGGSLSGGGLCPGGSLSR